MKFSTVARRCQAGACVRTGLVGITAGLVLAGGAAMGASDSMARAAVVSAAQAAGQTAPEAPTGLVAAAGVGQVTLSWAAPTSGSEATSYKVHAGTVQDFQASTLRMTVRGPAATVSGLTGGTRYYFWVTAANSAGTSPSSNVASATPVSATPGSPTGLTATAGQGQVMLSWVAPASGGASPVTGYDIYVATTPAFRGGTPAYRVTGAVTSFVVTSLPAGATYYFTVAAVNSQGAGPMSAVASATIAPGGTAVAPGAPTQVEARPGRTRVVLLWVAPAANGSAKISGYLVYEGTRPGGESSTPVSKTLVRYTATAVPGLNSSTRYYFKVAAVDAAGHRGALSAEVSAVPWPAATSGTASGSPSPAGPGTAPSQGQAVGQQNPAPAAQAANPTQAPPRTPVGLIIGLAAVAMAAIAGAIAIAVHLRRIRIREGLPEAFDQAELDNRPSAPVGGPRHR